MLLHLFGASVTSNWNYLENNLFCCDVQNTEEIRFLVRNSVCLLFATYFRQCWYTAQFKVFHSCKYFGAHADSGDRGRTF